MIRAWSLLLVLGACGAHASSVAGASDPDLAKAREKVGKIELCKTTDAEVRAWFGEPVRDGRQGRLRIEDWGIAKDPERVLAIVLDDHGVVVDVSWDTPGASTWIPTNQCAPPP
jgi:hypothetical protein